MTSLIKFPSEPLMARHLIAGQWIQNSEVPQAAVTVSSPYSGKALGRRSEWTPEITEAAVAGAARAFNEWKRVPLKERTAILLAFRGLLIRDLDELANSVAREAGKTVAEGRAEILKGIEVLEFAASIQNSDRGGVLEVSRGVTCEYRREPLGVVVGITPFNFPAMVPMWMIPIAVTLGNAFILKPSDKVPFTPCMLGELMIEAGFPAGVFTIVHGGREAVESLVAHPDISAVAFVGSTPIARSVYTAASSHGKRALCLGGAKNHLIVVPDADPLVAVDGVVSSFTGCAGQRCMAASVMVAVGDVEHIISAVREAAARLSLGDGMGALIDQASLARLRNGIEVGTKEGGTLLLDGRTAPSPKGYEGGNWLGPTIIDNARPDMECWRTELFGPVLTIVRVATLDDALALDGSSPFGNATSVFTTSGAVARYVADRAGSGMIGINIGVPVPREPFSFGGTKASRFGYGDITGEGGVEFWSNRKKITTKWSMQSDKNWMS